MKKIVFIHPLALFFLYFLVGAPAAMLILPAGENPADFWALALACLGLSLSMIFGFFWPYAVYKYLARQKYNRDVYDPDQFDKFVLVSLILIPIFLVADVSLRDTQVYDNLIFTFIAKLCGGLTLLFVFGTLGLILWSIAKMLKGGVGWCLALINWPIFAAFVQNKIRELYPEGGFN